MSEVVVGWKSIAAAMRMSTRTAERMARRRLDPMPVRKIHGGVYARPEALAEWHERQHVDIAPRYVTDLGGSCRAMSSCNDRE